jgi:hypothetical protein
VTIFQHTCDKVVAGIKTQTRRLAHREPKYRRIGEYYTFDVLTADPALYPDGTEGQENLRVEVWTIREPGWITGDLCIEYEETRTVKWKVGNTYAVQPGRGKRAVAHMRITDIRREDVRDISDEDVQAEGFYSKFEFLQTWCQMHDKAAWKAYQTDNFADGDESGHQSHYGGWLKWLKSRPVEHYDAWVLTFELVS